MQTATVSVAIAGDQGNTVRKTDVTPAEVAVLRAIHGDEAVFDIEPTEDVDRGNRAELERIGLIYRTSKIFGTDNLAVQALFPGAAARVFDSFDELGLDESAFLAETRAKPKKADAKKSAKKGKEDDVEELDGGALS